MPGFSSRAPTGFEVQVPKILEELTVEMKELCRRVDHSVGLINDLPPRQQPGDDDPLDVDLGIAPPVQTMEALDELDERLEDQDLMKSLVRKLYVCGGNDVMATVKGVMVQLMGPVLCCKFNWTGARGKKEFGKLKLVKVIFRAVRQNRRTRDAPVDIMKGALVSFLFNARDMDGGRVKRKRDVENEEDSG